MKQKEHNTSSTLLTDVVRWRSFLIQLHARLAPYIVRPEPYQRVLRFVQAVLSQVPR